MPADEQPKRQRIVAPISRSAGLKSAGKKIPSTRVDLKIFQSDPVRVLYLMAKRFGPLVGLHLGQSFIYVVQHPDFARHVLQTRVANYRKSYGPIAQVFGDSILITQGQKWQKLRKLSQPAFATARLRTMPPVIASATDAVLEDWERAAGSGAPLAIDRGVQQVTLNVVLGMLFNADIAAFGPRIMDEVETALVIAARFAWDVSGEVRRQRPDLDRRFTLAVQRVSRMTRDFMQRRGAVDAQPDDLLKMLFQARDDPAFPEMTDRQVRNEIVTFVIAGYETTATALSWTIRLLAEHPEVQARVKAEIDRLIGDRVPDYEDLDRLPLIGAVFAEAMRLYPPVPMLSRFANEADSFEGTPIPKAMQITISAIAIHRRPELWERADAFWPDRFLPEHAKERYPFSYLPFSAGPRACIGHRFAMIEGPLVLARMLQRFRFGRVPAPPSYVWSISMRQKGGQQLLIERW